VFLVGCSSSNSPKPASTASKTTSSNKFVSPEFFQDIGKTFNTLKKEYPDAVIQNYNIPDASAQCLGEPKSKYAYYFFGTQDVGLESGVDVNKYGDKLKCAGFYSTAGVLFPEIKDNMSIADFFSAIGVSSYEYSTEVSPNQGWIEFKYKGMDIYLDTSGDSISANGNFIPVTYIKSNYPVAISDSTIEGQNLKLVDEITEELNQQIKDNK
jgi:hypothetical protein